MLVAALVADRPDRLRWHAELAKISNERAEDCGEVVQALRHFVPGGSRLRLRLRVALPPL